MTWTIWCHPTSFPAGSNEAFTSFSTLSDTVSEQKEFFTAILSAVADDLDTETFAIVSITDRKSP